MFFQRKRRWLKRLIEPPIIFVFLSFLFGLSNFVDTFLMIFFRYMFPFAYPPVNLKPLFFVLQSFCLSGFLFQMTSQSKHSAKPEFRSLLILHLAFFVIFGVAIFLFSIYEVMNPGVYSVINYRNLFWRTWYLVSLSGSCFWFFYKLLRKHRFRIFSIIFLLIGLAFFAEVLNETYRWPSDIERVTMYSPAFLMGLALFCTWIYLLVRKKVAFNLTSISKFLTMIIVFLLPSILDNYKSGLINLIIRSTVDWGLGYSGYGWHSVSLYLASFVAYIFLIKHISKHLDQTLASNLILLGVVSSPWNGLMILDGYSSIPGNMLSIDALIVGFFLMHTHKTYELPPLKGRRETQKEKTSDAQKYFSAPLTKKL